MSDAKKPDFFAVLEKALTFPELPAPLRTAHESRVWPGRDASCPGASTRRLDGKTGEFVTRRQRCEARVAEIWRVNGEGVRYLAGEAGLCMRCSELEAEERAEAKRQATQDRGSRGSRGDIGGER